jgi:hypothetical protein
MLYGARSVLLAPSAWQRSQHLPQLIALRSRQVGLCVLAINVEQKYRDIVRRVERDDTISAALTFAAPRETNFSRAAGTRHDIPASELAAMYDTIASRSSSLFARRPLKPERREFR